MTAVDVDALAKLRSAATTDGEWRVDGTHAVKGNGWLIPTGAPENAALIVASVNALPGLLAEVRRGRALREAVEGLAEELEANFELGDSVHRLARNMFSRRLRALLAAVDAS